MAWAAIFLYLVLIAPVDLGIAAELDGERSHGRVAIRVWGVERQGRFSLMRDAQGKLRLMASWAGRTEKPSGGGPGLLRLARALVRADKARALLRRGVSLRRLQLGAVIGGADAAQTALFTGLLRAVAGHFPRLQCRFRPAFGQRSRASLRCIVSVRLGMIGAAGVLGLLSLWRTRKKEETAWIIPSGI